MKTIHEKFFHNRSSSYKFYLGLPLALLLAPLFTNAQPCPAPAAWFPHNQTPAPNPNTFPQNANDCNFHLWAWQSFLYLTQNQGGQPRFLTYPTDADLFPSDPAQKPMSLVAFQAAARRPVLKLRVRGGKPKQGGKVENPNELLQASGDIFVAQDGNPVFYSVHFDPTFYKFVHTNQYYEYSTYTNANPNTTFPVGATEFKASWKIIPADSQLPAYKTQAQVPTLSTDTSGNIIAGPPMRNVTVALVGIHIVGVVAFHPEFIWATFEQVSNAPELPPNISPSSGDPVSSSNYTFYAANTPASNCNAHATVALNSGKQTLSPITQVFRQFADGGGVPDNTNAINTLNASVHTQLASTDVWNNYNLIGGVWLLPGALHPGMSPQGTDLHGSQNLGNSTMETFVQNINCFTCHTTTESSTSSANGSLPIPAMNMNLSHILTDGLVTREANRLKLRAR